MSISKKNRVQNLGCHVAASSARHSGTTWSMCAAYYRKYVIKLGSAWKRFTRMLLGELELYGETGELGMFPHESRRPRGDYKTMRGIDEMNGQSFPQDRGGQNYRTCV